MKQQNSIINPPSQRSTIHSLCAEKGLRTESMIQMCQNLGINLFFGEANDLKVELPDSFLSGDYLTRGRICHEIEAHRLEISQEMKARDQQKILLVDPQYKQTDSPKNGNKYVKGNLTENDISIIESYPSPLHSLLQVIAKIAKMKDSDSAYTHQELENLRHNMRHLFVPINSSISGWHPADFRTLWEDGWNAKEIVQFMASKKVKYILCHNDKVIQCLNLDNTTSAFYRDQKARGQEEEK